MTPFECYKEYLALKNHFTKDNYDYFKYNGKVRTNAASFDKRKDKIFFQKLAKHPDVHNFLVSNLVVNPKFWIKDLAYKEEAETRYKEWLKLNQSFTYNFKKDLKNLSPVFNDNFMVTDDDPHPLLLRMYLGKHISLETMCVLLDITKAKKHWDSKLEYDIVYEEVKMIIEKYTPFIKYDKEKIKKILLDSFS